MDNRTKIIEESFEKHKLTADSYFMFHCTMCGDCCRNRDDILLTPKDLFKLAKGLNMTPKEVVDKYGEVYIGHSSNMTVVRLKSVGADKHCVFLEGNKCSVQAFKPGVCALFPLGRYMLNYQNVNDKSQEVGYIFTNPGCGDKQQIHTVRSWLRGYDIPAEDEYFIKWSATLTTLSATLTDFKKSISPENMNLVWNLVYCLCYLKYDIQPEFLPQFIRNSDQIIQSLCELDKARKPNGGKK